MSSSEDMKDKTTTSMETLNNPSGETSKRENTSKDSGNEEIDSGDGNAGGAKSSTPSSKLTATAKEWKPSASAPSFQPRVQPQAMPPPQQQQGGFVPGYGQDGFYGNMPQGYPMVVSTLSPSILSLFSLLYFSSFVYALSLFAQDTSVFLLTALTSLFFSTLCALSRHLAWT